MDVVVDPPLDGPLRAAMVALWVEVSNAGGSVGFVPPVSPADVLPLAIATFDRVAAGRDHLVVGMVDERPVGFAFLEQRDPPIFRHWATVKRLQVHPALQGQGLGSQLLIACEGAARDLGLEQLHLTVRGGTGTEAFYFRHGYELVATIPGVIRVAPGDDRDELYLVKRL